MKRLLSLLTTVGLIGVIAVSTTKAAVGGPVAAASVFIMDQTPGYHLELSKTNEPGTYSNNIVLDQVLVPTGQSGSTTFYSKLVNDVAQTKVNAAGNPYRYEIEAYDFNNLAAAEDVHVTVTQGVPGMEALVFDGTLAAFAQDMGQRHYLYYSSLDSVLNININYSVETNASNAKALSAGQLTFKYVIVAAPY